MGDYLIENGDEPVFPLFLDGKPAWSGVGVFRGLTKREYIAAVIMSGANFSDNCRHYDMKNVMEWCTKTTDALLAELDKKKRG